MNFSRIRLIVSHDGIFNIAASKAVKLESTAEPAQGVMLVYPAGPSTFVPWSNIERATIAEQEKRGPGRPPKAKGD